MSRLAHIMSSPARVRMLETLDHQSCGLHLRQVAALSGTSLRSVQLAAAQLVRQGLVLRHREGNRVLFRLNRRHPDYGLIAAVLRASANHQLQRRAARLYRRAGRVVQFAESARELLSAARRNEAPQ